MEFIGAPEKKELLSSAKDEGGLRARKKDYTESIMETGTVKSVKSKWCFLSAFLLGAFVGFSLYGAFFDDDSRVLSFISSEFSPVDAPQDTEEDILKSEVRKEGIEKTPLLSTGAPGENTLVASDQPAGSSVLVSMVAIDVNGWVAIHEAGEAGDVSDIILGARRFDAGKYFAEKIDLLRVTEEGKKYFAVLHADDGDSMFDYTIEVPLRDGRGELISGEFIATSVFKVRP